MVRGVLLEDLTWLEAEQALGPEVVVVLPLGAAAKEHGPHLLLKNDLIIANYLRDRLLETSDIVAAPTLGYHHADEIETSMMLYIAPETVDMSKAVNDYHPGERSGLSRQPGTGQTYSKSGIFGDATLATQEKGQAVVEVMVAAILNEIEELRASSH